MPNGCWARQAAQPQAGNPGGSVFYPSRGRNGTGEPEWCVTQGRGVDCSQRSRRGSLIRHRLRRLAGRQHVSGCGKCYLNVYRICPAYVHMDKKLLFWCPIFAPNWERRVYIWQQVHTCCKNVRVYGASMFFMYAFPQSKACVKARQQEGPMTMQRGLVARGSSLPEARIKAKWEAKRHMHQGGVMHEGGLATRSYLGSSSSRHSHFCLPVAKQNFWQKVPHV